MIRSSRPTPQNPRDAEPAEAAGGFESFSRLRRRVIPAPRPGATGLLARLRIRKKLILLHTLFSLVLMVVLLLIVRGAVQRVVEEAEGTHAETILASLGPTGPEGVLAEVTGAETFRVGSATEVGIDTEQATRAARLGRRPMSLGEVAGGGWLLTSRASRAVMFLPERSADVTRFVVVEASLPSARRAVANVYLLVILALLGVYVLVALALEALVLPRQVWSPIREILEADRAVKEGRTQDELIAERVMPADELGEIMRSRNETVRALRSHEAALGHALARIEEAATELKAKNHLLETARRNLADADRLASIGMMSAGIAHELNTPLSVIKGIAEQIHARPGAGVEPSRAALMLRVVQRLERLSEGLLDFARVRPPETQTAPLINLAEEAITLVGLDRGKSGGSAVNLVNRVPEGLSAECDADRIVQVLVNVVRNSVDALVESGRAEGEVVVEGSQREREGRVWAVLRIRDNGPGIAPEVMSRLFEPFVSTRLDSQGSGLGLAVAEGIVRQHGGVLLARNVQAEDAAGSVLGAEFEIVLPVRQPGGAP